MFDIKESVRNQSDFSWLKKSDMYPGSKRSYSDVSINLINNTKNKAHPHSFSFTFRNKADVALGAYIDVAVFKNRIYFRTTDDKSGYKMTRGGSVNGYIRIIESESTKALREFIGDYDLTWDDIHEFYYIEKKK